jgi:hypothetical protein
MSKKFLVFAVLFSLGLSLIVTQEANALTNSPGQYTRTTTASFHPSKICGDRICYPGQNSMWKHAVLTSQREGSPKATGGYNGMVIMRQLVVNTLAKSNQGNTVITQNPTMTEMPNPIVNSTSPMSTMSNSTNTMSGSMTNSTSPMVNATSQK